MEVYKNTSIEKEEFDLKNAIPYISKIHFFIQDQNMKH